MEIIKSFSREATATKCRKFKRSSCGKALLPHIRRRSRTIVKDHFILVLRSRGATLSTVLDRLHPGRRSSDPELKQSWETPSRHEYCQSAPGPSSYVRCRKQFPRGAAFRKRERQGKNQNGRAHSLPSSPGP